MRMAAIVRATTDKLKESYPVGEYSYYGFEVTEGFQRPCFFVQAKPDYTQANYNLQKVGVELTVTYFARRKDEVDAYEKIDTIREMFSMNLHVGDRFLNIRDFDVTFIDKRADTPQMVMSLEFFEQITHAPETEQMMEEMEIKYEGEM